ncbi:hypothetical protein CROQUDRAFT_701615 [Cronartium quercuum f. sp. fusiforme G11]|uniref:Uncharacterized protein n=1 Tax=Cronartium quercuum f. sp. fusiforme G11 TaxID=708437 RepID=A0A9P6THB5_9BASI|nr:hypothetical protein CROQUDRAFT_701615 [Cronartium quercuum f. sp. fusiforme G11]
MPVGGLRKPARRITTSASRPIWLRMNVMSFGRPSLSNLNVDFSLISLAQFPASGPFRQEEDNDKNNEPMRNGPGLGILIGLMDGAVAVMARSIIQDGQLKASIDPVERVVTFQREHKVKGDVVVCNVAVGGAKAKGEGVDEFLGIVPATIRRHEVISTCLYFL